MSARLGFALAAALVLGACAGALPGGPEPGSPAPVSASPGIPVTAAPAPAASVPAAPAAASNGPAPAPAAAAKRDERPQPLSIKGALAYRERIALPPDSTAVVELRDTAATADARPVAESRDALKGRQVPVPFELSVDRGKFVKGRRYTVRGVIVAGSRQAWFTEPVEIDAAARAIDLGTLWLVRHEEPALPFRASGNEPGWRVDITDRQMILVADNGRTRVEVPTPVVDTDAGLRRYRSPAAGVGLTVTIFHRRCADTMSGMPYPNVVVVNFAGRTLYGCGGEPAALLHGGEWLVDELAGAALADGSPMTLVFASDGRLSGRASCNSYTATYSLNGEGLSVSKAAATMRACAPSVMQQERLFFDLLAQVRRFGFDAAGALLLHTGDGRTVRARRE